MVNSRKISFTAETGYRILIVEDNRDVRNVVSEYLIELGCHPVPAKNAAEGFAHFRKKRCDAVISDYRLHGEGGLDLLERIRRKSDIPFLIMTGYPTEKIAVDALNLGADGFLYKPFTFDEFESALTPIIRKRLLEKEEMQAERVLRNENNKLARRFYYFKEFDRFSRLLDKTDSLEGFFNVAFSFLKKLFKSDVSGVFLLDGKNATLFLPALPEDQGNLTGRLNSAFRREMTSSKIHVSRIRYATVAGTDPPGKNSNIRRTLLLPLTSYSGVRGSLVLGWEKMVPFEDDAAMVLRWIAGKLGDRIDLILRLGLDRISSTEQTDTANIMR